jgi:hypothetical protein
VIVLTWAAAFGRFWYDFVIGDDWTIAALLAVGLLATFGLSRAGVSAWWLMPLVATLALVLSLWRARRVPA